jgi:DNA-binding response OmpR family regulator
VYLQSAGYDVCSARDGPSGLAAIRREKPVAVILDIRLPRMDGWEVLQSIRADPETSDVPVVVVSVLDERVKGLALGAADYLVKPASRDDVVAALTRVGVMPR